MWRTAGKSLVCALLTALAVVGCAGISSRVPPVDDALVASAAAHDIDRPTLERGRKTYLHECSRCHTPLPVSRYDELGWREILPQMYEKAYLSRKESEDLAAYLLTVSRAKR